MIIKQQKGVVEDFIYQMAGECNGQCLTCPYFYKVDGAEWRLRCFKNDVVNYVKYQAERHK